MQKHYKEAVGKVDGSQTLRFLKALKRSALGGESFFQTTATAGPNGGFVDLAMGLPGDSVILTSTPNGVE